MNAETPESLIPYDEIVQDALRAVEQHIGDAPAAQAQPDALPHNGLFDEDLLGELHRLLTQYGAPATRDAKAAQAARATMTAGAWRFIRGVTLHCIAT